ncbi:MAG: methyltransferase domain-containing protein [Anaerolineae bacterium]
MSDYDRTHWDARYASGSADMAPSPLVVRYAPRARGLQLALDIACGAGRNALYLASLGYDVDAVDISVIGLDLLAREAAVRGLAGHVHALAADLDEWRPPAGTYALVTQIAFFDPAALGAAISAVALGGMLILEAFNPRRLETRPNFNPSHLIAPDALLPHFEGWTVAHYDEAAGERGDRTQIVAQRPS